MLESAVCNRVGNPHPGRACGVNRHRSPIFRMLWATDPVADRKKHPAGTIMRAPEASVTSQVHDSHCNRWYMVDLLKIGRLHPCRLLLICPPGRISPRHAASGPPPPAKNARTTNKPPPDVSPAGPMCCTHLLPSDTGPAGRRDTGDAAQDEPRGRRADGLALLA